MLNRRARFAGSASSPVPPRCAASVAQPRLAEALVDDLEQRPHRALGQPRVRRPDRCPRRPRPRRRRAAAANGKSTFAQTPSPRPGDRAEPRATSAASASAPSRASARRRPRARTGRPSGSASSAPSASTSPSARSARWTWSNARTTIWVAADRNGPDGRFLRAFLRRFCYAITRSSAAPRSDATRSASSATSARARRPSFSMVTSAFLPLALTLPEADEAAVLQHRAGAGDRPEQPLAQPRVRERAAAGWASAGTGPRAGSGGRPRRRAATPVPARPRRAIHPAFGISTRPATSSQRRAACGLDSPAQSAKSPGFAGP